MALGPRRSAVFIALATAAAPVALLALAQVPSATAAVAQPTFNITDFSTSSLVLNHDAQFDGPSLGLTDHASFSTGSAWYPDPFKPELSFTTQFTVSLSNGAPDDHRADGIALVLQAAPSGTSALGAEGGGIGYQGITPSVAIELDDFHNSDDPDANHIGVTANGDPAVHLATQDPGFDLYGSPFTAWVDYNASSHALSVFASRTTVRPSVPAITITLDIAATLGSADPAFVGFTASTGADWEDADVTSWSFGAPPTTVPPPSPSPLPPSPSLPTLPELDGGTFVAIHYRNTDVSAKVGQFCTTGFNAIGKSGVRYSIGAKHCITGDTLPQDTNIYVPMNMPLIINTDDNAFRLGTGVSCFPPAGITPTCLLPSIANKLTARDVYAWRPDSAHVSGYVQTTVHGKPMPVLGIKSMSEVKRDDDVLCHFGRGLASDKHFKSGQDCGKLAVDQPDDAGYWIFHSRTIPTDSGGPVYVYKRVKGRNVGVYAVGVNLVDDSRCKFIAGPIKAGCRHKAWFIPIKDALDWLNLDRVAQAPPLKGGGVEPARAPAPDSYLGPKNEY